MTPGSDGPRQEFLFPTDRRKRQKARYGTAKWEHVRAFVLARDNYVCTVKASKKCRVRANTVDHIIRPEEWDPPDDPAADRADNLRASCRSCNMVRHNAAYFREKVDAAAAGMTAQEYIPVPERRRPASGDVSRYMAWALALPLLGAEPDDHDHGRWAVNAEIHHRGQKFAVCPVACADPVRWEQCTLRRAASRSASEASG